MYLAAAGIGTLLNLPTETIYQAVQQALHVTTTTRQSRKGEISTWKAHAPAFAGKMAVEAVDRAMRGEGSPAPIWEGEDGVIAWLLEGPEHTYQVPLPGPGEEKRAILDTYTKEHSAEYQSQAPIDLARRMRDKIANFDDVESIVLHTSNHTHVVIGTGSNDPQKFDPDASRETLDHSVPYIFAVALQDGSWHHERSYAPERAHRSDTIELWRKISTVEDPEWTRRYHSLDPAEKAFGARAVITLKNGEVITDELAVADAHPLGARPFARQQYINKFLELSEGVVESAEQQRFLAVVDGLKALSLVFESSGGRAARYEHNFQRVLGVPEQSAVLLGLLMLRGPQTAGELRLNAERWYRFADISSVEGFLNELAERYPPRVTALRYFVEEHPDHAARRILARRDITEAELERVMAPFYRVEGSRNRHHGGVGLGLSIARDIVARHQGRLQLRNAQGGGLLAIVVLPRPQAVH